MQTIKFLGQPYFQKRITVFKGTFYSQHFGIVCVKPRMHFCSSLLERSNKIKEDSDSDSSTRFIKSSNRANPLDDSESDTDNKPVKFSHSLCCKPLA
jgi:hypothetical protein